jgi:hypothetical protein
MSKPTGKPNGRPPVYTEALADEICERIANGESKLSICKDSHIPNYSTISKWELDDVDGFSAKYARARDIQGEYYADRAIVESEDALGVASGAPGTGEAGARVMAKKILADNLKWRAGTLNGKYSNRVKQEISGPDGGAIQTETKTLELTPELQIELDKINQVSQGMVKPEGLEE